MMTRNEKYMFQAYLLLLRRTLELIDEETQMMLEQDRLWKFYRDTALRYKARQEAEITKPS